MRGGAIVAAVVAFSAIAFSLAGEECGAPIDSSVPTKNYPLAIGETLFSDLFVYSVDRYIGDTDFSKVSLASIRTNLHSRWEWDQSLFSTNQIMHPLHGYSYFAAGRSNGLSFYESTALAAYGSANWELFGERCAPAMNDLLETTLGGAVFGEMFHRLYLEAEGEKATLAALASPVDAINNLITGRRPEGTRGKIEVLTTTACVGYAAARRYQGGAEVPEDRLGSPELGLRLDCVYGDPFSQDTCVPFDQFEMSVFAGGGDDWYDATILADGYLFAYPFSDDPAYRATLGASLHYDVLMTKDIQFAANALDLSLKGRRELGPGLSLEEKYHAGAILLGVANFYEPDAEGSTAGGVATHDYGTGANVAASLSLAGKGGVLDLGARLYWMMILPETVEDSQGTVLCQRYSLEYTHPLGADFSFRVGNVLAFEQGRYCRVPDVWKVQNETSIGLKVDLRN